jgi:predicted TIM-barrel fold metal-dependent hydrolase
MSGGAPLVVCDPHVHIWDLATGLYPARVRRRDAGEPGIGDYHIADLRADCGPVVVATAVHVEAFPTDGLAEALHVTALAEAAGGGLPQGIVANADLSSADADAALGALAALPRVRGIRQALNRADETRDLLRDPRWREGFALLARHGLSFDLQIAPERMREAAALLAGHPEIPVALNHAGWPKARGFAQWQAWRDGLRALAALPQVHAKISGFGMFERDWTLESIRPYAFEVVDAFGTDRVMFASNFPVDRLARGYPALWQAFAALADDLDPAMRDRVLRANAEAFYRL